MSAPEDEPFTLPAGLPRAAPGRVRVLSLSGGGYRGLFTAALIRALEARLGPDPARPTPFGQRFDLIAGTSIGGILATALSCRATGAALQALLQRRGSSIFPPMRLRGLRKLLGRAPYDPQRLRSAICELLPDAEQQLLGEHAPALLLTTVNWTTSKLQLLGSRPTLGQRDQLGLTLMDAMLATSAAPAHFPVHSFQHHRFVDGGLAANAPDLHALLEHYSPQRPARIVAHSMGANIAGTYAGVFPQRVAQLVMLDFLGLKPAIDDDSPTLIGNWLRHVRRGPAPRVFANCEALANRLLEVNPRLSEERAEFLSWNVSRERDDGAIEMACDPWHKVSSPFVYRIEDVEAFERSSLRQSTDQAYREGGAV